MLMRQLRQNTKWIMIITAAAFVALMVFEWGADMSGQTAGGDLGRVGRTTITPQQFQATYRNLYDQIQREQDSPISSAQNREIEDMAWDQIVNQVLIQMELERRGIGVTDEEIRQAVRYAPPPELRNDPAFQTDDGRFDFDRYHEFLSQATTDPRFLQQLEQYYRDMIPREKLLRQLAAGVFVTDEQLWREWRDRNEQVSATFVNLDPRNLVAPGEAEVDRSEIERYYREHRDEFAVPSRARIRYVYLDATPTAADTAAVRERAEEVRREILEGEDFAEMADRESRDEATARDGGRLGTVSRGDLTPPLDEAVFSLPVGQVSEPVQTRFGLHIVEVLSRDGDEAEARHILLPFERTTDSELRLLTRADSLEALGRTHTLDEAAETFGLEVLEGEITEDFAILAGVGLADEGQDWIFEEREGPGAVSPVFESADAFYMMEIVRVSPAGYLALEDVTREIEEILRTRKKTERAMEMAREWVREIRDGTLTLEEVAERAETPVRTEGPFSRTDFVPGLGTRNAAIGLAFGTPEGEVGGPVRFRDRVVVLRVEERIPADREAWEEQKGQQRLQAVAELRQERLERWLDGLRETVRIEDRRAQYFRQVEEADDRPQMPLAF